MEGTAPRAWVDLIFGLTEGWWRFEDADDRTSHPLVSVAGWRRILSRAGFDAPAVWPDAADSGPAGQAVLVASRSDAPQPARVPVAAAVARDARPARWILVGGDARAASHLAGALARRGAPCEAVSEFSPDALFARGDADVAIVCMPAEPSARVAADTPATVALAEAERAVSLVRQIGLLKRSCSVWFITRGVHGATDLSQAPLWGIARTLALEEPDIWGGTIDVDGRDWAASAEHIAAELLDRASGEDLVVYRDEVRLVPRVRAVAPAARQRPCLADGTWLITGGFGAFGLATAEFLVSRGIRRLCLVGRRGPASDGAREALGRLEAAGVTPLVFAADVTSEPEMRAVVAAVQSSSSLRGVIHAAGATGYGLLRETPAASLAEILRPKVVGGWLLHRLTREIDLQHFICYSSMVSVWGARGQGPYVAANHFLDALAHHRRALGLPAVTVNWGPLAGGGMVPEALAGELRRMGVTTTPMREAVTALDQVLDGRVVQPIAVDIEWDRFRELHVSKRRTSMFDLVRSSPAGAGGDTSAAGRDVVRRALPAERRDVLLDDLRRLAAQVITARDAIDTTAGLFDLGLDSLGAMELRRLLERRFGLPLPSTLLFDCGTLEALTDDMLSRLGLEPEPRTPIPDPRSPLPDIDALTEEELESRLLAKLRELD
jgi:NAD(P)-dependent dehydrogenase (short-subunit alcohol dehydrogenase family)/acyl carrier protein